MEKRELNLPLQIYVYPKFVIEVAAERLLRLANNDLPVHMTVLWSWYLPSATFPHF